MNMIARDEFAKPRNAAASNLPVVLLHGTAMDPTSWTGLREYVGQRLSLSVPDLSGYVAASGIIPSLDDIAEAVAEDIFLPECPVHLVGHDFGAVLAMKIAAASPGGVASLTLIEPTAFNALSPVDKISQDVAETVERMRALLDDGDAHEAMENYIDLINGEGTWERTSQGHRDFLSGCAHQAMFDLQATLSDRMTPSDLAGIVCPALLIRGGRTQSMLEHVALELRQSIPFVRDEVVADAGHFPHLTDPHVVDPKVVDFLVQVNGQWQDDLVTLRQAA